MKTPQLIKYQLKRMGWSDVSDGVACIVATFGAAGLVVLIAVAGGGS